MHYTYLLILAFTLSYPLLRSFENKINYASKWKFAFPAIFISAIVFIAWDVWFTNIGVWSFNNDYVIGCYLLKLPIEEWLFFLIIPFSCVFIYEVMNYFVKTDLLSDYSKLISIVLIAFLLITAGLHSDRLYTLITFISLAIVVAALQFLFKSTFLSRAYLSWAICLIPFLIVDGVITGMPILIYYKPFMLNVRIFSIPLEDAFYGMLQFLLVISVYEYLKQKRT